MITQLLIRLLGAVLGFYVGWLVRGLVAKGDR